MTLKRIDSLHVITTLGVGGAERQLLTLLGELARHGHHAVVQPVRPPLTLADHFIEQGIRVLPPLFQGRGGIASRWIHASLELKRRIHGLDPAVLHAHLPEAELICLLSSRPSMPLVVTRHTALPYALDRSRYVSRVLSRLVEHRSAGVIAISDYVAQHAQESGELSTLPLVIPYGIRETSIDQDKRPLLQRQRESLILGCAARLVEGKGLQTLISALPLAQKSSPIPLVLEVAGDGPLRPSLKRLITERGLSDCISLLGHVEDMDAFYRGLDVFVLPSESEGLGLVLLEAMSHGIPVIAADNTAMSGLCEMGKTGTLFETGSVAGLAEAILKLTDESTRRAMADATLAQVRQKYSLKAASEAHLEEYFRAIQEGF